MQVSGSQAIIPKARGMYAKRISRTEYEELLRRRTVPEIAGLLKKHPFFGDSLATLSTADPHRGQIEELLAMDIFAKYKALLRYDFEDDSFADFYLIECEVRELVKILHLISIGMPGAYIKQIPPYLHGKIKLDLFELGGARSLAELVELLRFTPYYKVLRPRLEADPALRNYPLTEAVLLRYLYADLFERIRKSFSGRERDVVSSLFLQEVEIYNLELIYRLKAFFAAAYRPHEIQELLLPYIYRVPKKVMQSMVNAQNLEALLVIVKQSGAEKITGPVHDGELDATGGRVLYRHAQKVLRLTNSPSAALGAFLSLVKLERDNVVNIVEGVRYGLPPEKIKTLLRG